MMDGDDEIQDELLSGVLPKHTRLLWQSINYRSYEGLTVLSYQMWDALDRPEPKGGQHFLLVVPETSLAWRIERKIDRLSSRDFTLVTSGRDVFYSVCAWHRLRTSGSITFPRSFDFTIMGDPITAKCCDKIIHSWVVGYPISIDQPATIINYCQTNRQNFHRWISNEKIYYTSFNITGYNSNDKIACVTYHSQERWDSCQGAPGFRDTVFDVTVNEPESPKKKAISYDMRIKSRN